MGEKEIFLWRERGHRIDLNDALDCVSIGGPSARLPVEANP
jgi:hypothetical protein